MIWVNPRDLEADSVVNSSQVGFGNTGSGRLGENEEREVHLGLLNHLDQIGGLGS